MFYKIYNFEIGKLAICEENQKIVMVNRVKTENDVDEIIKNNVQKETELIKNTRKQLDEYFAGNRKQFDIPIKLEGTDFQIKVWKELLKIPYGETCSYLDIAKRIGNPKASRAVGMANNKNKIIIIVPCHRVIGSNKKLVGYACGLEVKEKLLELERKNS